MTIDCPFSDEDCTLMNDLLQKASSLKEFYEKCAYCNAPVGPLEVQRSKDEETLRRLKATWFPTVS